MLCKPVTRIETYATAHTQSKIKIKLTHHVNFDNQVICGGLGMGNGVHHGEREEKRKKKRMKSGKITRA
jgi:hypothetical protein